MILSAAVAATTLYLSYSFAEERWVQKDLYLSELNSLRPLDRNPQWAVQPAQLKRLEVKNYTDGWYYAIGRGIVTVLIWTFI